MQFFDPVLRVVDIFAWGENNQLRRWAVGPSGALTFVADGHEYASVDVRGEPPGGMPGGFCAGDSNGSDPDSAIIVSTIPYGDANAHVVNGRLLVYDPVHLAKDGTLQVLWDSQQWAITFLYNKFNPPVIDGGQIYVPNYNGCVDVYRLPTRQVRQTRGPASSERQISLVELIAALDRAEPTSIRRVATSRSKR